MAKKNGKVEEVKRTAEVEEYLKYGFSDAELLDLSKTLAKHNQDLKRVTADFAAKIQAEESQIGELSRKVSSGYEFHSPSIGKKTVVRLDTGEEVRISSMSSTELQEQLPFKAEGEAEQPTV